MSADLQSLPKKSIIDIRKIFNQEYLMPKAKVIPENPVDVTNWTKEEIVTSLDEAFERSKHEAGRPAAEFFRELETELV